MISLIMSTYNGAEYIVEQLDSIRLQSRTADEVIICDDCSTDNTVAILQDYVSYYSLSAWKIKRNNENKGWKRNFRELLQEAQGEIIFPCDQDDIWQLDKIERMTAILQENPDIKLLASNYTPIYTAEGQKLSLSREEREENQSVYKPTDLKNFFYIMRPGCVYAVKKELVKYFDTYISEEDPHDAFLWRIATLIDSLYIYNSSTIFFRRHSNNATRRVKLTKQAHIEKLNYYADVIARMRRFLEQEKPASNETTIDSVECFRKWISLRQELQNGGGIMTALKLLPYLKCYYSPRTYLADLYFLLMKGKSVNEDKS